MSEEWVRETVRAAIRTSPELAERWLHDPMYRVHAETVIRTLEIVAETLGELDLDQAVLPVLRQTIIKGLQKDLAAIEYRRAAEEAMSLDRKQSYAHLIDQLHRAVSDTAEKLRKEATDGQA